MCTQHALTYKFSSFYCYNIIIYVGADFFASVTCSKSRGVPPTFVGCGYKGHSIVQAKSFAVFPSFYFSLLAKHIYERIIALGKGCGCNKKI